MEQFLVFVQEGLTLGCIGDDEGDAGGQFDRSGKPATTGSDDSEFGNTGGCHLGIVVGTAFGCTNSRHTRFWSHLGNFLKVMQISD
jgi:hypothetical protein